MEKNNIQKINVSYSRVIAFVIIGLIALYLFFPCLVSYASVPLPNYPVYLDLTYLSDNGSIHVSYDGGSYTFGGATHGNLIVLEPYDLDDDPMSGGLVLKPLFDSETGLYYYLVEFNCNMLTSAVRYLVDDNVIESFDFEYRIDIDYYSAGDIRFVSNSDSVNSQCNVYIWFTDDPYQNAYDDGYDDGYDVGYGIGYSDGYNAAIDGTALEEAFNEGYNRGYNVGIEYSVVNTITNPLDALFGFEIYPQFTIGTLMLVIVGVSLVLIFLKYFAGG